MNERPENEVEMVVLKIPNKVPDSISLNIEIYDIHFSIDNYQSFYRMIAPSRKKLNCESMSRNHCSTWSVRPFSRIN